MRIVAGALDDLRHLALVVEHDLGFGQIEVDAAARAPLSGELLRQLVRGLQVVQQGPSLGIGVAGERFRHAVVGEPRVAPHHCLVEVGVEGLALLVEGQVADHAQAVHVGVQRADPVREALREHGQDGAGKIHAGGAPQRLAVQGPPWADVMGHVRDGDHQTVAAGRAGDVDGVVEVPRVLAVDGHQGQVSEIAPPGDVVRRDVVGHALGRDQRRRLELVREPLRVGGGEDLEARIARRPEHRDDLAFQRALEVAVQPDLHHLAVVRPRVAGHGDVSGQVPVVRNHPGRLPLGLVDAEDELSPLLDDLDHLGRQATVATADHPCADHVAVEGTLGVLRGYEEVVLAPTFPEQGRDEAVALRFQMDDPGHLPTRLPPGLAGALLAAPAGALGHGGGRATGLVPPRLLGRRLAPAIASLRALAVLPLLAFALAADVAIVARSPLLEQVRGRASERVLLGLAQPELTSELLQGEALSARAAQRGEETLEIDVHGGTSRLSSVRCRRRSR